MRGAPDASVRPSNTYSASCAGHVSAYSHPHYSVWVRPRSPGILLRSWSGRISRRSQREVGQRPGPELRAPAIVMSVSRVCVYVRVFSVFFCLFVSVQLALGCAARPLCCTECRVPLMLTLGPEDPERMRPNCVWSGADGRPKRNEASGERRRGGGPAAFEMGTIGWTGSVL